ncbi:ADP-ribosylation factor-like protein 6-interacting protein 6 [Pholidichthys leucotaenia]
MSGEKLRERPAFSGQQGVKPWSVAVLSVLSSAAVMTAVGFCCALLYPIIKELRTERVRAEDGTEERMLGFWSILVLSVLVGCVCFIFSWTLTYLDSYQPGMVFPTLSLPNFSDASGNGLHLSYGVAVLIGLMSMLTVMWSLS